jgi:hypothetical protein
MELDDNSPVTKLRLSRFLGITTECSKRGDLGLITLVLPSAYILYRMQ